MNTHYSSHTDRHMPSLTLFLLFHCMLLSNVVTSASLNRSPSGRSGQLVDCSVFQNDQQILSSWGFRKKINPTINSQRKTYVQMNTDGHVYELNIYHRTFVPPTIVCFKHLTKLTIQQSSFLDDRIPAQIDRLAPTLTHLSIFDTTIASVPEQIGNLSRLTFLEMVNTSLQTLPDSVGKLHSLTYLCLKHGKLESIPTTLLNIPFLTEIDLSYNPTLRSIQPLNDHLYLKILQADHCAIEQIPLNIRMLTSLYMDHNKLTNLINIDSLGYENDAEKVFHLDYNLIEFISPEIQLVINLHSLNLNYNELSSLPSDIYEIKTLRYLMIDSNRFSKSKLQEIVRNFKTDNPLVNVTAENQRISSI